MNRMQDRVALLGREFDTAQRRADAASSTRFTAGVGTLALNEPLNQLSASAVPEASRASVCGEQAEAEAASIASRHAGLVEDLTRAQVQETFAFTRRCLLLDLAPSKSECEGFRGPRGVLAGAAFKGVGLEGRLDPGKGPCAHFRG